MSFVLKQNSKRSERQLKPRVVDLGLGRKELAHVWVLRAGHVTREMVVGQVVDNSIQASRLKRLTLIKSATQNRSAGIRLSA